MSDNEPTSPPSRRPGRLLIGATAALAALVAFAAVLFLIRRPQGEDHQVVLKIGDQRGAIHALMTAAGVLEGAPYKVEWATMPAAAPLLEALSAGAVDLGGVGGAPFAFAYSNGGKIKVVLASRYRTIDPEVGRASAIIVRKDSPIRSVADLRGRKLATIKGSAGHDLTLRILEREGVDPRQVIFVYLNNGDAKAALAAGSIDAWSTWGSYVGIAVEEDGDRILADARGLRQAGSVAGFNVASDKALAGKRAEIRDFLARYIRARDWARTHREEFAAQIAKETELPIEVARYNTAQVTATEFTPIDSSVLDDQRATFQRYLKAGVIDEIPPLDAHGYDTSFNDLVAAKAGQ